MALADVLDILSWLSLAGGAFFTLVGAYGIIRLPDVYARMHAAGMIDTLGLGLFMLGLMFQAEEWIVAVKLGLIFLFVFFTSPTTTFALARAAIDGGAHPGPKGPPPAAEMKTEG